MKIGIDLDNTLVDYDSAFLAAAEFLHVVLELPIRSKLQIREYLRSQPAGEATWQRLQGLAYGRCVHAHARLYPGVKRFLWRCRQNGHNVVVISHKTEHGHEDIEKIPLRKVASEFLAAQGLAGAPDAFIQEVIFENSYEEKMACIKKQSLDWFIDDLSEVILDLSRIGGLKTIRFDPALHQLPQNSTDKRSVQSLSDWQQIDALINGEWTRSEVMQLSRQLVKIDPASVEKLSAGGNAGVYRLTLPEKRSVKLKIYPVDPDHDRLFSELTATNGLSGLGCQYVSRPLAQDVELGIGVYEWIEGDPVKVPSNNDLESSLEFLGSLHALRNSPQFVDAPVASAACFSGRDIEMQIKHRLRQFELPRTRDAALDRFLAGAFLPTFGELVKWARDHWPKDVAFDSPLSRAQQTLSPSDFGFHNAIRRPDGSLAFSDFEYFGWDDPVKLMSDFNFHPGMSLSDEQKAFWLKRALKIYGEHLSERLKVCLPLYGMIWCLILLNDFRPEIWQRRLLADDSKRAIEQDTRNRQLAKAQTLLEEIRLKYADPFAEVRPQ